MSVQIILSYLIYKDIIHTREPWHKLPRHFSTFSDHVSTVEILSRFGRDLVEIRSRLGREMSRSGRDSTYTPILHTYPDHLQMSWNSEQWELYWWNSFKISKCWSCFIRTFVYSSLLLCSQYCISMNLILKTKHYISLFRIVKDFPFCE